MPQIVIYLFESFPCLFSCGNTRGGYKYVVAAPTTVEVFGGRRAAYYAAKPLHGATQYNWGFPRSETGWILCIYITSKYICTCDGQKLVARIYSSNALWGCCDEIRLSVEFVTVGFLGICRHSYCD